MLILLCLSICIYLFICIIIKVSFSKAVLIHRIKKISLLNLESKLKFCSILLSTVKLLANVEMLKRTLIELE